MTTPDGLTVAYRRTGAGAPTVILVHGWMTSGAVFDALVTALDGVTCVVPDLIGTGASSRPETGYALMRYAADVLAVIDDAAPGRVVVLGHSMGGQIAQLVAATRPEGLVGLVLVNPVPLGGLTLPEAVGRLFRSAAGDIDKLATILGMAAPDLDPGMRRHLLDLALDVTDACMTESFDAWTAGGFEERLGDIAVPTLVVASDDAFLPQELLQQTVVERIPGATLGYVAGAGHYPLVERPEALAAQVQAFLRTL